MAKRGMSVRGPVFAAAVIVTSLVVVLGGVVLLSASGDDAEAAAQEQAQYVPFLGEFHMSCTWGAAKGVPRLCRDKGAPYHPHPAIDFQLPMKTEVTAAGAGVVTFVGESGGFGKTVVVYHAGDNRSSMYAHLHSYRLSRGDRVLAGQPLALSGNTGTGTGPHLHYAEAKGRRDKPFWSDAVDPGKMIGTKGGRRVVYPDAMGNGDWRQFNSDPDIAPGNPHRIGRDRMPELPGDWANHIVQWDADKKAQKTSWLVNSRYLRNHIESSSQFFCLQRSHPGPVRLPAATLDQLADQIHQPVTACADPPAGQRNSEVVAPPPPTTIATIPQVLHAPLPTLTTLRPANSSPPPTEATTAPTTTTTTRVPETTTTAPPTTTTTKPKTYPEQQGSRGADTFTNYHNASGKGPRIEPYQWVEVSCKVYDPTIESVNPDGYWYRIASSPWDNRYYAAANTFWNGDTPGQQPYTHNTDWNVPDC